MSLISSVNNSAQNSSEAIVRAKYFTVEHLKYASIDNENYIL